MFWDDVSYVLASRNRKAIILKLEYPKTPTLLAGNLNLNLANVSRTLSELDEAGLVVCLTPKKRVGRIYSLTNKGKKILSELRKLDQDRTN